MGSFYNLFSNVIHSFTGPFHVGEVQEEHYVGKIVILQDDHLTLYEVSNRAEASYHLLWKVEGRTLRILRVSKQDNACVAFYQYQEKLPQVLQCVPDIATSHVALQNVLQTIQEKDSWSVPHVLAHLGYTECFRTEYMQSLMMQDDGLLTPLHVAIKAQKLDSVTALLEQGAPMNAVDAEGNTAMHYTALYCTEMSKASLLKMIELLVSHGCDVNKQNFKGDSVLHLMVGCLLLDCVILLLSQKAAVDLQNSDGNTPLHLAVKKGNKPCTQALIVFEAKVDVLNNQGESPRHIAATHDIENSGEILYILQSVGAKRCLEPMYSCEDGCSPRGYFNGIPQEKCKYFKTTETVFEELLLSAGCSSNVRCSRRSSCSPEDLRLLCLDGGGIRGLVLIQMLGELEMVLGKPILECFDVIAGTSTGGIFALLLATGRSIHDCRCLYFKLKNKVFVGMRPYDTDTFEAFLKEELGETAVMGDITKPKLMITATRGDRQPTDLHLFRNYRSPIGILNTAERDSLTNELFDDPKRELIWQVARATGAAPTYFSPSGKYIDGGLIANNPTMDALTEIHQCNEAYVAVDRPEKVRNVKVVLSLGTGRPPLVATTPFNLEIPNNIVDAYRLAMDATVMIRLLVDQASQTDGRVTSRTRAFCKMVDIPYFRLNPQLSEDVQLDETKTEVLVNMMWETMAYMRCMSEEVYALKELLLG